MNLPSYWHILSTHSIFSSAVANFRLFLLVHNIFFQKNKNKNFFFLGGGFRFQADSFGFSRIFWCRGVGGVGPDQSGAQRHPGEPHGLDGGHEPHGGRGGGLHGRSTRNSEGSIGMDQVGCEKFRGSEEQGMDMVGRVFLSWDVCLIILIA